MTTLYERLARDGVALYRDRNICSVVALAVAAEIEYGAAYTSFASVGRRARRGTRWPMQVRAFAEHGLTLSDYYGLWGTLGKTLRSLPRRGTFLVYSTGHVSCYKDGVLHDWVGISSRKRVRYVAEVKIS